MNKIFFTCILLINIVNESISQTSFFEDSKGQAAFKVFDNAILINTKNESVSLSFNILKRDTSNVFNRIGISLKVTAKEGVVSLKNNSGFLIDGELGVYYGYKFTSKFNDNTGWANELFASANILIDRNKFYNLNNESDKVVFNEGDLGWKMELGDFGYIEDIRYGGAINFGQQSNLENLKQNTIAQFVASAHDDSVAVSKSENAYDANTFKRNQNFMNFIGDIAYLLNNDENIPPLFAAIHLRYYTMQHIKSSFDPAIGFYVSQNGSPLNIVAGIQLQLIDAFNVQNSGKNVWQRTILNAIAGYNF